MALTEPMERVISVQAGNVRRELTIERKQKRQHTALRMSQRYPTTVEELWDACTQSKRLNHWFAPVSGDLRIGGRYQVEGNASGEIIACVERQSFTVTWEFGEDSSEVSLAMEQEHGRARLTLEHRHSGDAQSEFWTQFGPGATGVGWDLAFLGLARYLVGGQERPEDPGAFAGSSDAQDFIRLASEGWGQASMQAGTPREAAEAAAQRTTAFYLGQDPS